MDHYIDFRIHPDPEFSAPQVMSILFTQLHLALVALKSSDIGVSFPEVDEKQTALGRCLRLHAKMDRLQAVIHHGHFDGLRDYMEVTPVSPVPEQTQYRQVRRVQSRSNPERLLRRQMHRHDLGSIEKARQVAIKNAMERHGLSEKVAIQRIDSPQLLALPFIDLRSKSTEQSFRLFIKHGSMQTEPLPGNFNRYGLSLTATVPWWR
jgi:CRISPR-associated endonuclease Csy4